MPLDKQSEMVARQIASGTVRKQLSCLSNVDPAEAAVMQVQTPQDLC